MEIGVANTFKQVEEDWRMNRSENILKNSRMA
jgi:hypothetical protein